MEHIIASNLMKHLESNNILYDLQHGFRSSRSCETQLTSFIQELAKNNSDKIQTDVIVMDFAKAFDKVPHKRLLYKLKYYGTDTNTLNWIEDFLTLRTQTVILDGEKSEKIHVTSGVPQGTVLGPILFLVYILRLFADDSILYKTIKDESDTHKLQEDLDQQQNGKMTGLCNSILTNAQSCTYQLRRTLYITNTTPSTYSPN